MKGLSSPFGVVAWLAYGAGSIWAAWLGLDHVLPLGWAVAAMVIVVGCLYVPFTLPLAVAAFLGAFNVWHWPWFCTLVAAVPALAVSLPAFFDDKRAQKGPGGLALGFVAFLVAGGAAIWAGYLGLDQAIGGWAVSAMVVVVACLFIPFTLPLAVVGYFGVVTVWDWPWYGALPFALVVAVFTVPAVIRNLLSPPKRRPAGNN
jgi:hypothetical protein